MTNSRLNPIVTASSNIFVNELSNALSVGIGQKCLESFWPLVSP
jgi:hypothetical protein